MMKPSEQETGVAAPVDRIVRQDVAEIDLCSTYAEYIGRFGGIDHDQINQKLVTMIQSDCTINEARVFRGLEPVERGDVPISQKPVDF